MTELCICAQVETCPLIKKCPSGNSTVHVRYLGCERWYCHMLKRDVCCRPASEKETARYIADRLEGGRIGIIPEHTRYKMRVEFISSWHSHYPNDLSAPECTCENCPSAYDGKCEWAWDLYNTDGDCLAVK